MSKTRQYLDLNKVKETVFQDIEILLKDLNISYEMASDNIFMKCPIHGGDNPNGLSISLRHKNWKCWTHNCDEDFNNDIFGFIRGCMGEDASFSDALRLVRKLYNVGDCEQVPTEPYQKEEPTELQEIVNIFKNKETKISDTHKYIRDIETLNNSFYFEKRGFLPDTLEHFRVKDCIDRQSTMWNRAIIPVDFDGEEVGYVARATKNFIQPKYLFSKGFKKTEYLYNYDKAVESGIEKHTLFLVEGQGDVWRLYEAGVTNAVGLFGKDISLKQISLLVEAGVYYLVVLTDNDQAGREGKMKIQRELSRMFNLIYPPMPKKDIGDMSVKKIEKHILPNVKGLY